MNNKNRELESAVRKQASKKASLTAISCRRNGWLRERVR
jgi:hypothetical protein